MGRGNGCDDLILEMIVKINKVYFIVSLDQGDESYSLDLFESIVKRRCDQNRLQHEYIKVSTCHNLIRILKRIEQEVNLSDGNLFPMVHFESHGSVDGMKLINTSVRYSWDNLASDLKAINRACQNNLLITMGSCFGGYLNLRLIDVHGFGIDGMRSPAAVIIGPKDKITNEQSHSGFANFFNELLESKDIDMAFHSLLSSSGCLNGFAMNTCEQIFRKLIDYFISEIVNKRSIDSGLNSFIAEYVSVKGIFPNDAVISKYRSEIASGDFINRTIQNIWEKYYWIDVWPENANRFKRPVVHKA